MMMKKKPLAISRSSYAWFIVTSCSMLLLIYTQLHTWAVSMHTNCNTPPNDTPYDNREKELQSSWNDERQRLQTEIRLLKKEIDNASVLFNREMKQSSVSIVDIFENQSNNITSEQTADERY